MTVFFLFLFLRTQPLSRQIRQPVSRKADRNGLDLTVSVTEPMGLVGQTSLDHFFFFFDVGEAEREGRDDVFLFVHLVGPVLSIVPSSFFEVVPMAITRAKLHMTGQKLHGLLCQFWQEPKCTSQWLQWTFGLPEPCLPCHLGIH